MFEKLLGRQKCWMGHRARGNQGNIRPVSKNVSLADFKRGLVSGYYWNSFPSQPHIVGPLVLGHSQHHFGRFDAVTRSQHHHIRQCPHQSDIF